MAGLSANGFLKPTLAEIKAEMEDDFKLAFGNQVNLSPGSVNATLIGIFAERESLLWEAAEGVYQSQYPNSAEGVSLANIGAITNSAPRGATKSFITAQLLFGTPGTSVPALTVFSVANNPTARFVTADTVVLGTGVDEVQHLAFSLVPTSGAWNLIIDGVTFALTFNQSAAAIQTQIQADGRFSDVTVTGDYTAGFDITFAGDQGKRPWDLVVVNDTLLATATPVTVTPTETTLGVAQVTVRVDAETAGPVAAPTGLLTVIETPVTGLTRTLNLSDAVVGENAETAAEFRLRRISELAQSGAATLPAIRTKLKQVADVNDAIVFENTTLVVDGDGRPPKSIQVFVDGGEDQAIGEALWLAKPGGIETFGDVDVTLIDSQGLSQTVYFNRPTPINIWVEVDVESNDDYPVDGDDQVINAILAYAQTLVVGQDILVYPKLLPAIVDVVAGIEDIEIRIGTAINPTLDDNVVVAANEIAKFDSARIEVAPL